MHRQDLPTPRVPLSFSPPDRPMTASDNSLLGPDPATESPRRSVSPPAAARMVAPQPALLRAPALPAEAPEGCGEGACGRRGGGAPGGGGAGLAPPPRSGCSCCWSRSLSEADRTSGCG